jgi:ankyrin repeat protein
VRRGRETSNPLATTGAGLALLLLLTPGRLAAAADLRLVEAARAQNRADVDRLVRQRVDVDTPQADGATPLLWAAQWDDLAIAERLLDAGAKVDAANVYGVTPLSMACTNGSAKMVDRLLKAGANPNAALQTGETPIMTAALTGKLDVVNALLGAGVDVNAREAGRGQTALMWAVSEGHRDVVKALVQRGADVRARSASGFTPLMFAARQGDLDLVTTLLAHGAGINESASDGVSVLHVATLRGHVELAELLLDEGADPNADGPGYTALHWAAGIWESYMTRDYRQVESGEWSTLGGIPTREGKLRLIKALLAKGAQVNPRLTKPPPLFGAHLSLAGGRLLGGGSVVGATPLLVAAHAGDVEVMRLLIARGADPLTTTDDGTTPLMMAAGLGTAEDETLIPVSNRLEAAALCVELGMDVNAANEAGNTALHATAFLGLDNVARFLLDKGAHVNQKNKKGETPLKVAEGFVLNAQVYVHPTTAELLRQSGAVSQ